MRRGIIVVAIAVLVAGLMAAPTLAQTNDGPGNGKALAWGQKNPGGIYLVMMKDPPAVAYDGGIGKLKATRPAPGRKLDSRSKRVRDYVAYLDTRHDEVLAAVGAASDSKIYDYRYTLDGFAAQLTKDQVAALRKRPDVVQVWDDQFRQKETDNTPDFLELTDPSGGLWADLGLTGEDVIIGVIDSGVWPENPAFSDQEDFSDPAGNSGKRNLAYGPPPSGWSGECETGEQWSKDDCNNKLIGARYFNDGFGVHSIYAPGGPDFGIFTNEYHSPRDADGHGSHTASTAGGNDLRGESSGTSGMAARARIAVYKVLWDGIVGGAFTSDIVAAIDAAVADGVDVINYSIGSSSTGFFADDIAFLFAADAGVMAVTSNGNDGPGAGTIGSPSKDPWITSVGANRDDEVSGVVLDETSPVAQSFDGLEGTSPAQLADVGPVSGYLVPVVDDDTSPSPTVPLDGCSTFTNDTDVSGQIALIIRGGCAFETKFANAAAAGAVGVVVYNDGTAPDRIEPIIMGFITTPLPGMMISFTDGDALDTAAVTPTTVEVTMRSVAATDHIADFSSRGPSLGFPDVIKPDVAAPGVDILAAFTEAPAPLDGATPAPFAELSGTSMSSPHVAGVSALIIEYLRDHGMSWSPAMIRSALMTTARQDLYKETLTADIPADPFDIGAGHMVPNAAVDPGLVYDADFLDYLAFLCGAAPENISPSTCTFLEGSGYSLDPSDLNLPSIAVADLLGEQTVSRWVTNVGGVTATYNVSADAPPGISVIVNPTSLNLDDGEPGSYEVTFTYDGAPFGEWTFGSLTWDDGAGHAVYSPIAIRPVELDAPAEVAASPCDDIEYDITFGYTGSFAILGHGLDAATETAGNVLDDPGNDFSFDGPGVTKHDFYIPAGTELARFALFDDDTDGNDDLDLYVFSGTCASEGTLVGSSASPTATETVDLVAPAAGDYCVAVHGWQTDGADSNYTLFSWTLADGDDANATFSGPTAATVGVTDTVMVSPMCGSLSATRYLGAVTHHRVSSPADFNDDQINFTVISVDNR